MSMASEEEVLAATGAPRGAVSPFGLPAPLRILADESIFTEEEVSIGSGLRGTTVILAQADLRRLLGEVEALANIALDPGFAGAVIADYNSFTLGMVKLILGSGYRFDALWVFSDLCYKNGLLFSPRFYEQAVLPHQRRLFDLARENGMKVIYHCDGNVRSFLPLVMRAGIDCIQPLEARAGNVVQDYLRSYPGVLSFMGNVDMDAFTTTKERIRAEVTGKILSAKASHRYLFHSDHSVPDSVSLENYGYAIRVAREVAGL